MGNTLKEYVALPVLADYHTDPAMFKWIRGGVGGSKSYSLIHQCLNNTQWFRGSINIMGRKVEHILEKTLMRETIELCLKYGLADKSGILKTKKEIHLLNGSEIQFWALNLPITEFGSINANWIGIDEASEIPEHIIKYMFTRLRRILTKYDEPVKHEMNFSSTWEGHNHLWRMFFRDNRDDPRFKTWKVKTSDNPYLPEDYEDIQRSIHSEEWCRRYLDCEETSFAGLVYDEIDSHIHEIEEPLHDFDYKRSRKCISIDTGLVHPTAMVVGVLDAQNDLIYIMDEYNRSGIGVPQMARIILGFMERYGVQRHEVIIDPSSESKEQTSGTSVRKELMRYLGFLPRYANKNKSVGIEKIKRRLTVRADEKTGKEYAGMYFIRGQCKELLKQGLEYVWLDSTLEEFEIYVREEPKKQKDDIMDAWRYLVMELDKVGASQRRFFEDGFDPRMKIPYYRDKIVAKGAMDYMNEKYKRYMAGRK